MSYCAELNNSTLDCGGILSGFASRYKPNSFVRDAVVDGGSRMGAGGSVGFVGRTFGGMAARNGTTLTAESVSSVTSRPPKVSGTIAGDIAGWGTLRIPGLPRRSRR